MEEMRSSKVKVHTKLTVVSSKPIGPGKIHRFTPLDHGMGLHSVHVVFYYKENPFKEGPMKLDLDNLRISLSEYLCLYPAVTGRLTRDVEGNWEVKCNDAGVRTLRATVNRTLDEWLRSADGFDERDLTVWEDLPDDPSIWSPFQLQVNDFEDGGMAIGLSCSHMHADPTTATLFFKSWSDVHRGDSDIAKPPLFNLPASLDVSGAITDTKTIKYYATKSKSEIPSVKMATTTFKFSDSMIKKCLSHVQNKCPDANPFDLLAALFWSCISRTKSHIQDHKQSLSICVDFRKHKNNPIPYEYFGNALHFSLLSVDAEDLQSGELSLLAGRVHEHVEGVDQEEFKSTLGWFGSGKGETGQYAAPFRMYGPELACVSMEHMIIPKGIKENNNGSLMYGAMFKKDEKPVHVSYHFGNVEGEGLIAIMPSPDGGFGRTVTVTLPEEQLGKLCQDPGLLNLEPIRLFSGRI